MIPTLVPLLPVMPTVPMQYPSAPATDNGFAAAFGLAQDAPAAATPVDAPVEHVASLPVAQAPVTIPTSDQITTCGVVASNDKSLVSQHEAPNDDSIPTDAFDPPLVQVDPLSTASPVPIILATAASAALVEPASGDVEPNTALPARPIPVRGGQNVQQQLPPILLDFEKPQLQQARGIAFDRGTASGLTASEIPTSSSLDSNASSFVSALQMIRPVPLPNSVQFQAVAQPSQIVERHLDLAGEGRWLDNLAHDIIAAGTQQDRLSFRLDPERLGRLDVDLVRGEQGVRIQMTTSSDDATKIIATAQPRLVEELRGHGLRVSGADVQNNQTSSDAQHKTQRPARPFIEHGDQPRLPFKTQKPAPSAGRFA